MTFIVFEGIDGSGKSTQCQLLKENLEKKGKKVFLTREPGGTKEADYIREIIKNPELNWERDAEVLLFIASRIENLRKNILPALKQGKTVICDRFIDSTLAYQHYGFGYDMEKINVLHKEFNLVLKPDLTILLDLDPIEGLKRDAQRNKISAEVSSRFERQAIDFHKKVRAGFLELSKDKSKNYLVLDATKNAQELSQQIINKL
jgi:dTMP kinase